MSISFKDDLSLVRIGWIFAIMAMTVAVIMLGGGLLARQVGHHYSVLECHTWSSANGRQTKFVDYSTWSWDCLTPSGHGTWISTSNVNGITGVGK